MKRSGSKSAVQGATGEFVLRTHPQTGVIEHPGPVDAARAASCSLLEIEIGLADAVDNMTTSG